MWPSCWPGGPVPGSVSAHPKQLIEIAGKPIIEHSIAAMQDSSVVDEILVVVAPGYLDEVRAIVREGAAAAKSAGCSGGQYPYRPR